VAFVCNNWWAKRAFPGVVTGKVSDLLACYFLPLFLSACLFYVTRASLRVRLAVGCAVTVAMMVLLKTSPRFSELHDLLLTSVWHPLRMQPSPNRVDPTDLVALPMVLLSWWSPQLTLTRQRA